MAEFDDYLDQAESILREKVKKEEAAREYEQYVEEYLTDHAAPHCDPRVLHSPGKCPYCDSAKVLQLMRQAYKLPFTDELQATDPLLPGADRSRGSADRWAGNQARGDGISS